MAHVKYLTITIPEPPAPDVVPTPTLAPPAPTVIE